MNVTSKYTLLVSLAFSSAACAPMFGEVDGYRVNLDKWEQHQEAVRSRASFELSCPPEQLQLRVLGITGDWPTTIGVEGCGYRAVFVYLGPGSFAMNSVTGPGGEVQTGAAAEGLQN